MKRAALLALVILAAPLASMGELAPDRPLESSLDPGGEHVYRLQIEADWFVSGRVDQQGVDLAVTILDPGAEPIAEFHTPASRFGPESFSFKTGKTGEYAIRIAAGDKAQSADYRIELRRLEPVAAEPADRVDQLLSVFDEDTPGVVVGVVREGELVFTAAAGMADLAFGIPFEPETRNNIGSTSKQFLGYAMALLDARGELSLDDDVREHLPELPDFGDTVTLRHLLTHTSGYREYYNTLGLAGRQLLHGDHIAREELIEVVRRQTALQNPPGAEWNYNNTGYGLLTLVVERVTGRDFADWMRAELFAPLGMHDTLVRVDAGHLVPGRSTGYLPGERGFSEAPVLAASMGAGGIHSTVADMARWMAELHAFELGGDAVRQALTTPFVLNDGEATDYGLGLFVQEHRGLKRWQHAGGDVAHRSQFHFYPELNGGYMVFSNNGAIGMEIANEIARVFFGAHLVPGDEDRGDDEGVFDPAEFDPAAFDRFAGRYELEVMPGFILRFYREEERFYTQATGQAAVELEPTSENTFRLRGVEADITFHSDADGTVHELTLHQNGDHRAVRLDDGEAPPIELSAYAGRYFSEELETFYTLEAGEDTLTVRHRRLEPVALSHARDDRFTGSFPIAELEFERDESGRVSGFRVGNVRARDIRFERVGPAP